MAFKNNFYNDYLSKYTINKGDTYSHTRIANKELGIIGGTFMLEENKDLFYEKYLHHVFTKGNMEYLTEKQLIENGPLLIDIDLRYNSNINTRQHTSDHIIDLLMLYANKITELLDIPDSTNIEIFVMEKNDVNILDDKTKDGIHIIFGIQLHKALQVLLREKVLKELANIWDDLQYINSIDDVIDIGITKGFVNWQLYGSRKPGNKAYLLKNIYIVKYNLEDNDWTIEENNITQFRVENDFNKLLARNSNWPKFNDREKAKEEIKKAFTIFNSKKTIKPTKLIVNRSNKFIGFDYLSIKNQEILDKYIEELFENINSVADYEIKETHQFVMVLPKSYYESGSYNKWIRVGWALKNTDIRLFLTWLKFSSQSSEFNWDDVSELYEMWENFDYNNPDGLTARSIMFWAKNDSNELYKQIRQETVSYFIDETIKTSTEWDLANVLYQIYKDQFVCVSIRNNVWY